MIPYVALRAGAAVAFLVGLAGRPAMVAGAGAAGTQKAVFAGGCFWGIEAVFDHVKGVVRATSGYAGGHTQRPSYEDVGGGETGHAESVEVEFDPAQVSYRQLLEIFFTVHDPTELNYQGPDYGTQYRSEIFYRSDEQKREAEAYIAELTQKKVYDGPIVTKVSKYTAFWPAESYHQDFMAHHPTYPYIVINDAPKVAALKTRFPALYREAERAGSRN